MALKCKTQQQITTAAAIHISHLHIGESNHINCYQEQAVGKDEHAVCLFVNASLTDNEDC